MAADLDASLRSLGLTSWRTCQRDIVDALTRGRDAFAVLPTGHGKSLCYLVPAQLALSGGAAGVVLVVSPLVSLDTFHLS